MTEREKLIELLKNDNCPSPFICDANCKYVNSENCMAERMADYLLENGVIVPPCKVSDTMLARLYSPPKNGLKRLSQKGMRYDEDK